MMPSKDSSTAERKWLERMLFILIAVCFAMTLVVMITGRGDMVWLVAASLVLFALSVGNYYSRVRRTYWQCVLNDGAADTGYERMHYRNGLRGINKPAASAFHARAAWAAGQDVAKASQGRK